MKSDENWIIKRAEIAAEHKLERNPNDLKDGWNLELSWKPWLKDNWPG